MCSRKVYQGNPLTPASLSPALSRCTQRQPAEANSRPFPKTRVLGTRSSCRRRSCDGDIHAAGARSSRSPMFLSQPFIPFTIKAQPLHNTARHIAHRTGVSHQMGKPLRRETRRRVVELETRRFTRAWPTLNSEARWPARTGTGRLAARRPNTAPHRQIHASKGQPSVNCPAALPSRAAHELPCSDKSRLLQRSVVGAETGRDTDAPTAGGGARREDCGGSVPNARDLSVGHGHGLVSSEQRQRCDDQMPR
ncbi:hypothetical protein EV126DRAFT_60060 [Verticillium dahliae]|nr:hypothetical protein EV126DRAFT_60060 [Verticillium dahliae]